jgi:hypothetical protein
MKPSKTAHLLEARQADRLVAFSIVDLGSARYAFYQFNFRSAKIGVPGASDLLRESRRLTWDWAFTPVSADSKRNGAGSRSWHTIRS